MITLHLRGNHGYKRTKILKQGYKMKLNTKFLKDRPAIRHGGFFSGITSLPGDCRRQRRLHLLQELSAELLAV